jgi:sulfur-oxidizing protein SoxZ
MPEAIRMRTALEGEVAIVKILMPHPMETGLRKDAVTGELVPIHYISHVVVSHNGRPVLDAQTSRSVSRNPFLELRITGAHAGDRVAVLWEDNRGESNSLEVVIK